MHAHLAAATLHRYTARRVHDEITIERSGAIARPKQRPTIRCAYIVCIVSCMLAFVRTQTRTANPLVTTIAASLPRLRYCVADLVSPSDRTTATFPLNALSRLRWAEMSEIVSHGGHHTALRILFNPNVGHAGCRTGRVDMPRQASSRCNRHGVAVLAR